MPNPPSSELSSEQVMCQERQASSLESETLREIVSMRREMQIALRGIRQAVDLVLKRNRGSEEVATDAISSSFRSLAVEGILSPDGSCNEVLDICKPSKDTTVNGEQLSRDEKISPILKASQSSSKETELPELIEHHANTGNGSEPLRDPARSHQSGRASKADWTESFRNDPWRDRESKRESTATGHHRHTGKNGVFAVDVATSLDEQDYDVCNFYYESGCFQMVARSNVFSSVTLIFITWNTIYLGVDADRNPANNPTTSAETPLFFQVVDNLFCIFFCLELFIRFMSFRSKADCLKDMWFKFDSILVVIMVWETWVMQLLISFRVFNDAGGVGPVNMIKILRLWRLARMSQLMRSFPELCAMIKGVKVAARAVGSALMLVVILIYVFSVILFQQLRESRTEFETLGYSMWTLLTNGVFLDGFADLTTELLREGGFVEVALLTVFVLVANLIVLNMLIGVLCEVVTQVADSEKEQHAVKITKDSILVLLRNLDEDNSGEISRDEMVRVLEDIEALAVLQEMEVDETALLDQLEMKFAAHDNVRIQEIMNIILMLRGDRTVTITDMVQIQTVTRWRISELRDEILDMHEKVSCVESLLLKAAQKGS